MFQEYYQLTADPFRLSPDHAFCYPHPSFAKGRAYMRYALESAEGFVVVTGDPGMGKTTLISHILAEFKPNDYLTATLVNTLLDADDLVRTVAYEFGVNAANIDKATVLHRVKELFTSAFRDDRPPLLVVDEAQNLSIDALEELRLLTNIYCDGKPVLQIFLVGQSELRGKLGSLRLRQLRQRIIATTHLEPLTETQTAAYILHRLKVVGWKNNPQLKASLLPIVHAASEGIPRRINQFCGRLMLLGSVEERQVLDGAAARIVVDELAEEHKDFDAVNDDPLEVSGARIPTLKEVIFD